MTAYLSGAPDKGVQSLPTLSKLLCLPPRAPSSRNDERPWVVFMVCQDECDRADQQGTLFMLTMHPMITRIMYLNRLISYMKSNPAEPMKLGVWLTSHG
jgi:hypothetical protein